MQVPVKVSAVEQGVWPAQPLSHQYKASLHPQNADGGQRNQLWGNKTQCGGEGVLLSALSVILYVSLSKKPNHELQIYFLDIWLVTFNQWDMDAVWDNLLMDAYS